MAVYWCAQAMLCRLDSYPKSIHLPMEPGAVNAMRGSGRRNHNSSESRRDSVRKQIY
jgi:hypothetical protein